MDTAHPILSLMWIQEHFKIDELLKFCLWFVCSDCSFLLVSTQSAEVVLFSKFYALHAVPVSNFVPDSAQWDCQKSSCAGVV